MKQIIVAVIVSLSFVVTTYAGEVVTLPKSIIVQEPTTDKIEKHSVEFFYGSPAYAVIKYRPIDSAGRVATRFISVRVENVPDNPATAPDKCTGYQTPWPGCESEGTGGAYLDPATQSPWDESTTDFTQLVAGFGATLKTRSDAIIYSDVQKRFDVEE